MTPKCLIYITLDLRRALWVSEALGAKVVCSYQSDLLNWTRERGEDIWCFQEEFSEADLPLSSFLLLSRALTLNMLRDLRKELKFIVFKPSNKLKNWAEKEGWNLVSAPARICRQLEDKVEFKALAEKHGIPVPKSRVLLWNEADLSRYYEEFGTPFVVQGRMGHAGNCTYLFKGEDSNPRLQDASRVKISQFISGPTYTVNGYVSPQGKLAIGPLWEQLMHVSEWNTFDMGTVGVTPVGKVGKPLIDSLQSLLLKIVPLFQELNYSGFFGLDMIWDGQEWYLIECNPRLTATVSLQCLIDLEKQREALLKLHAENAEFDEHRFDFADQEAGIENQYGQIILRNSKGRPWKIPKILKSGIYALDEGGDWKLKQRSFDARELEEGELLLLLSRHPSSLIAAASDFASIQFRGSALQSEGGDISLSDRFLDFYERVVLGYIVREKDQWQDRYGRIKIAGDEQLFLLRKPLKTDKIPPKARQTELFADEVIKLLGETGDYYLVEKVDGTRGWLNKSIELDETVNQEDFVLANKAHQTAKEFFQNWKDVPYLWGSNSQRGIDCSAFVQRYFWEVKGVLLPKFSQDQKAACSHELSREILEDDDLVFMRSKKQGISHVGLMRGGRLWHSSLETGVVAESLKSVEEKYQLEGFRRVE